MSQNFDGRTGAIAAAALLCSFLPFETSHILFMIAGAVGYVILEMLGSTKNTTCKEMKTSPRMKAMPRRQVALQPRHRLSADDPWRSSATPQRFTSPGLRDVSDRYQPSRSAEMSVSPKVEASPPVAPTFKCSGGWDAEVRELLCRIVPSNACHKCAADLVVLTRQLFPELLSDMCVTAFVTGHLSGASGRAYGVAVPDISLCLQIKEEAMPSIAWRLKERSRRGVDELRIRGVDEGQDSMKSQKLALRSCLQRFTAAGMKFKRTAFVGDEPKTTFVIPTSFNLYREVVPVDFYVTACTPQRYTCLLGACKIFEPRAAELIHLVKRWAKDRAICMSSKGHLPIYGWALLSIYYLQHGTRKPLLPFFNGLEKSMRSQQVADLLSAAPFTPMTDESVSTGSLFKGFFRFFTEEFERCREISICYAPDSSQPSTSASVPVVIKDPFDEAANVAHCMSADGHERLREELMRAHELCNLAETSSGSVLSNLLEPWAPLATAAAGEDEEQM